MDYRLVRMGTVVLVLGIASLAGSSARAQGDAAALFKSKCAGCHAADGTGNTAAGKAMKVRDLHSPEVQKQTDAQLTDIITNGKSPMPGYKGKVTDEQIKELVGYVRELGKK